MTKSYKIFLLLFLAYQLGVKAQNNVPIFQSKAYSIFPNRVEQGNFKALVISPFEMLSDYRSPMADRYSPTIGFKFSINLRDNEMPSGKDHHITLRPINGSCITNIQFGKQLVETVPDLEQTNLPVNTRWTIRLDMREVFESFKVKGYFSLYNGEKLYQADFKAVYVAGGSAPLMWDFNNLHTRQELQLQDPDADHIYETTLVMNSKSDEKQTASSWKMSKNAAAFPNYQSGFPIADAAYHLALEEMMKAVEPDSTFRTGKEWAGVWTRDISYSIILAMAQLQPKVAEYSLLRKVKNDRIIQDTGTGGAYPVSSDRMIWAVAAWELYKSTGDKAWLSKAFRIVKNSLEDDFKNIYDPVTGLVRGESSFLDWREQTYPRWMQPIDIYESENLGTNAVHYQANIVLAEMAKLLGDTKLVKQHVEVAEKIKKGIKQYLWMPGKGYYAQYLYGRNFKTLSPRAEALGEALCVWFGIADTHEQQSVVTNVPVMDFGIPCIYPQIPGIPPYHNNAVWPFVQTYWTLAAAKAGNENAVLESMAAIYRPAALFLTNKENFVAETGDFAGTQINSSNMLWSLSGSLALVHRILYGIELRTDSIVFHPFVPKVWGSRRMLSNYKCRNAIFNIEMEGFGNKIKSFEIDGQKTNSFALPYALKGTHSVKIVLNSEALVDSRIYKVINYTAIETPEIKFSKGKLSWNVIEGARSYAVLKNGKRVHLTDQAYFAVPEDDNAEYQVLAIDANSIESFISEPVVVSNSDHQQIYELEKLTSGISKKDAESKGLIEISKSLNTSITMTVEIKKMGTYSINFKYANGNGPINTENKCAIRTLLLDGVFAGTIVLPQRGSKEWKNFGFTNSIQVHLEKGKHRFALQFQPENENMNGEINEALLDSLSIRFLE